MSRSSRGRVGGSAARRQPRARRLAGLARKRGGRRELAFDQGDVFADAEAFGREGDPQHVLWA